MAETKRMTTEQIVGYLHEGEGLDFLRESLSWVVQQLMEAGVSELVGASTAGGATEEALGAAGLTGQVITAMPDRETLTKLLAEVERGALRVDVEQTLPLEAAAKALETFTNGHTKGKIVVTVGD